jgi:hypothetical protein
VGICLKKKKGGKEAISDSTNPIKDKLVQGYEVGEEP